MPRRSLLTPAERAGLLAFPTTEDEFIRYYTLWWKPGTMFGSGHAPWVWRMINTIAPLHA